MFLTLFSFFREKRNRMLGVIAEPLGRKARSGAARALRNGPTELMLPDVSVALMALSDFCLLQVNTFTSFEELL